MANLRDLRFRMKAIQQTLQVTSAMNLISTSKLRKGRRMLEDIEPFFTRIQKIMCDVVVGRSELQSRFLDMGTDMNSKTPAQAGDPAKRSAILVITSDKGMAGAYNANIFRETFKLTNEIFSFEQKRIPVLIIIGAIGYRYFIHNPYLIMENFTFGSKIPDLDNAKEIADYVISQYLWGMFDEVYIVYTHMYNAAKINPTVKHVLPLNQKNLQEDIIKFGGEKRLDLHFEYIPSEKAVFDSLVPMYMKGVIYGCLMEAYTSEQNSRMTAMDESSKNAREMLDYLKLQYNRIRQAGITQEMNEIVGGSAAL